MNFDFDINTLVPYTVTKFDPSLRIVHPKGDESQNQLDWEQRQRLAYVIDCMGEASRKAQGLRETITSYQRLQMSDHHRIYLMKDGNSHNGNGSIVGMLKVGEKNLFVYDTQGKNHEMKPLCILDFYVNEKQQRRGYGKQIFDYMLRMEETEAVHCAVDKPSEKSVRFLKKHYNLKNPISQVNNFVVFEGFFKNRTNYNVFVRNRRNRDMNSGSDGYINRKFSAEASYNRSDVMDHKNILYRTGSVDSRYNKRADTYIPDFNKPKQTISFKHLNDQFSSTTKSSFENTYGHNIAPHTRPESINKQRNKFDDFSSKSTLNSQNNFNLTSNFNNQFYQPFPSLNNNKNNSPNDRITSKPPLPSVYSKEPTLPVNQRVQNPSTDPYQKDRNYTELSLTNKSNAYNNSPFNSNRNMYDPFPSLNVIKAVPEFYGGSNVDYRKTRLW